MAAPDDRPTDPESGEPTEVRDAREHFARLTRAATRDREAERAFILAKIETVSNDPGLSDEEKRAAVAELQRLLQDEPGD